MQSELATDKNAEDFDILVVGSAINSIVNYHGSALFQPPDRPRVGQPTFTLLDAFGIDLFDPFGLRELVGGADTPTRAFVFTPASLLAASLLPLLFGTHRIGFLKFGCPRGSGQLLLQFGVALLEVCDALLGGLQLTLQSGEQIDQPMGIDPSAAQVFLELLDDVHTRFLDNSARRGKI